MDGYQQQMKPLAIEMLVWEGYHDKLDEVHM